MNFFQRLRFLIFGTPYVVLERWNGALAVRPVRFICGMPFTRDKVGDDLCKLLPMGGIHGSEVLTPRAWEPATPSMNYYFNPPAQ